MTQRKSLQGAAAEWHPHPKEPSPSLVPVVSDARNRGERATSSVPPVDSAEVVAANAEAPAAPEAEVPPAEAPPNAVEAVAQPEITGPFFAAGAADTTAADLADFDLPLTGEGRTRHAALHSASVRARRRYLARYVTGVVGVAGLIGLTALVRGALASNESAARADVPVVAATEHTAAAALAPAVESAAPPAVAPIGAASAAPEETAPAPEAPAESASAAPVAAASAEHSAAAPEAPAAPAPEAPAADDTSSVTAMRERARRALERGRLADAIQGAQAAVAADPSDADAWLILGAAHQSAGHYGDARQAFSACVEQATRGDRGECGAMLR